jgi:hypothetical protein
VAEAVGRPAAGVTVATIRVLAAVGVGAAVWLADDGLSLEQARTARRRLARRRPGARAGRRRSLLTPFRADARLGDAAGPEVIQGRMSCLSCIEANSDGSVDRAPPPDAAVIEPAILSSRPRRVGPELSDPCYGGSTAAVSSQVGAGHYITLAVGQVVLF